ncbi:glutathione S-transferase family protein [Crenobacter cavernae]|uniref:Glutathione S-transferase family protein n=1 Tax=Crenobacter cavernae TaxID=2290923 RepID=A0A345Y6H2_9NEIS|nr:glutathione S-transferase family protein [Crenobacter cavernae]AXK39524.1 glutathione S-transferase family protein [Crenobacter cavernae]RXZ44977.1 glutathione S-transferase family protein [Crenobacter cavernae]
MFKLIIGNKNYSSWSLRPWLVLRMLDEPFTEHQIPLYQADSKERIRAVSPTGRVPLLIDGQLAIWDSLAIFEYLAECFPGARLWPLDREARALARAVSAEMHSGFLALRENCPMDITHEGKTLPNLPAVQADIERIVAIWENLRQRFQDDGPFLFGHFTLADAMYAPVVTRFKTYGVELPPASQAYSDHILSLPAMREWCAAARAEIAAGMLAPY